MVACPEVRGMLGNTRYPYDEGGKSKLSHGMLSLHGLQEEFWSREPLPKRRMGRDGSRRTLLSDGAVRNLFANLSQTRCHKGTILCGWPDDLWSLLEGRNLQAEFTQGSGEKNLAHLDAGRICQTERKGHSSIGRPRHLAPGSV